MRPLHTSAVIFAFGGNVLIATALYVVQRTSRARLAGDISPWFVVLGYNFFILIAGTGYLLGITQSKEYAEPEWYADLFLTVVWVTFFLVFNGDRCGSARSRISMWRTGSSLPSSLTIAVAASGQQRHGAGLGLLLQVLQRLVGRAGCDGAMVVRP